MPVRLVEGLDRLHLRRLEHPAQSVRPEQFLVHLEPRERLPERSVRPGQLEQRDPQARHRRVLSSPVIQHL